MLYGKINKLSKMELGEIIKEMDKVVLTLKKENMYLRKYRKIEPMEEKKMDKVELVFRTVSAVPNTNYSNSGNNEELNRIMEGLDKMAVGEVLYIPIKEMYAGFEEKEVYRAFNKYWCKIQTSIKRLKKTGKDTNFRLAGRNKEIYVERLN